MLDAFGLARSIQKHVKRLKSAGYSHPPILDGERASFLVGDKTGRRYEVSVREISIDEELAERGVK